MYGARLKKLAGGVFALYLLVLAWTALLPVSSFAGDKPGASHPHKQSVRLLVTGGSITAGGPGLSGSFLVQNAGGRRSGRFSASVVIAAPGGNVVAKRLAMAPLGAGARRTVKVSSPLPGGLPAQAMPIRACVAKPGRAAPHGERQPSSMCGSSRRH